MEKINTQQAIEQVGTDGIIKAEQYGIDVANDEFKIVQAFDEGNAIVLSVVKEDGERTVKYEVTDTVIILEKKQGTLDVFK